MEAGGLADSLPKVAAEVAGEAFQYLRAPIARVALPDTPAPMSKALEREYYAGAERVVRAAESLVRATARVRNAR
jgi:pyruvate/2-oxoglutarate/acetoin dehydrogenase E1 component